MTKPVPLDFADCELASLRLGDGRLEARARTVLRGMERAPSSSVAKQQGGRAAAKACYRLLEHELIDHGDILAPHVVASVGRAMACRRVLAVQDTTGVSLAGLVEAEGLGPITEGQGTRGYLVHTTLLVDGDTHAPLGVASQIVWARPATPHDKSETAAQRRKRPRESEHWTDGQDATARAFGRSLDAETGQWSPPAPGQPRIVVVGDRESDIFELIEEAVTLRHGFVLRAVRDRRLTAEEEARSAGVEVKKGRRKAKEAPAPEIPRQYSMSAAAVAPRLGEHVIEVPRRPGRAARTATLTVRSRTMDVRPPKSRDRRGPPQTITYVDVREEHPPDGVEPLHWCLITDEPATTLAECVEVVETYRARWIVEEFHMALKTGVGIEHRQFESLGVHGVFLAFASMVAWRMLALRTEARRPVPRLARDILTFTQLAVLRRLVPELPPVPDARQALRAIAILGGFMGRKGDGEPGWRTIWWGFLRLLDVAAGYNLANSGSG